MGVPLEAAGRGRGPFPQSTMVPGFNINIFCSYATVLDAASAVSYTHSTTLYESPPELCAGLLKIPQQCLKRRQWPCNLRATRAV